MSLTGACWITLARTLVVILAAWPVCEMVDRWMRGLSESRRSVALMAVLLPFIFPEMLVGYAYRDYALAHPKWAEFLCGLLLFVRVVPVGAVALTMAPPPDRDAAAIHCRRLLLAGRREMSSTWAFYKGYWYGPVSRALPALGLMALIATQEFELAALLMATSWTDWFIMSERLGLHRTEMLLQSLKPLALQLPLLLGIAIWISREPIHQERDTTHEGNSASSLLKRRTSNVLVAAVIVASILLGVVVPIWLMGWRAVDGIIHLAEQRTPFIALFNQILVASLMSICSGFVAWGTAWWLMRFRNASRTSSLATQGHRPHSSGDSSPVWSKTGLTRIGWLPVLLPGLLGSLLVSLGVVTAFQQPWLRQLYDTPIPWGCALIIWLIPRAVVLQLWLNAMHPANSVHLAELAMDLSQRSGTNIQATPHRATHRSSLAKLVHRLRDEPRLMVSCLLCYWAYGDLPTAYLLAPTRMAPGLVQLYNHMHFGRIADLSGQAILFFGIPVIVIGLVMTALRIRHLS